jgi:hypothetical protein
MIYADFSRPLESASSQAGGRWTGRRFSSGLARGIQAQQGHGNQTTRQHRPPPHEDIGELGMRPFENDGANRHGGESSPSAAAATAYAARAAASWRLQHVAHVFWKPHATRNNFHEFA